MSAVPQPDECHGGVPTGSVGSDGQGGSSGLAGEAQSGTERELAALEDRLRDALADARQAVIDAVGRWRAMRLDLQGVPVRPKPEAAALIAAWDELVRIEGKR